MDVNAVSSNNETVLSVLNTAFWHRYCSLADYMLEAGPYVADDDTMLLDEFRSIAAFDADEVPRLAALIEELDGIPHVPPYHHDIAEMNYLSLRYLKTILEKSLARQVAEYERRMPDVSGSPKAFTAMTEIEAALRGQIARLQAIA